jgi:hypothetical protein
MRQQQVDQPTARPKGRPTTEIYEPEYWEPSSSTAERRARRNRRIAWEITLAFLAVSVIVAGVATFVIVELWLADRVLPGVYVWDVDVGGLTRAKAMERLQAELH